MNIHDYIESGLLELYAMGALQGDEAQKVADAIAQHPELRAEFEAISNALQSIAPIEGRGPQPDLKARILGSLPTDSAKDTDTTTVRDLPTSAPPPTNMIPFQGEAASVRATPSRGRRYLLAASFIGLLLSASAALWFWAQLQSAQEQLAEAREERNQIEQVARQAQDQLSTVRNYDNKLVRMTSTGKVQGAIAVVYWNPKTNNVYVDAAGMPPLPEDKQYQLWAIADGDPVDAGVFETNTSNLQRMKEIREAKVFAVTIEPRGGSRTPTLETMTVVGQL